MPENPAETSAANPPPPPRGHRLGLLAGIWIVALAAIGVLRIVATELDRNIHTWITLGTFLLASTATFLWLAFLSRIRWKLRIVIIVAILVGGFALSKMLTRDGAVDGRGLPRLVWKWSKKEIAVTSQPGGTNAIPATVNLTNISALLADVPQFFGPQRDGVVRGVALATDWNASQPKLLWRQPIGIGWSAFAVVCSRAYTEEQRGDAELVTCYDIASGRLLWAHTNLTRFVEWQGGDGPRATPTVNGGRVFAYGATGILDCLDATNGVRVWSRNILKEFQQPNLNWGTCSSPLVVDDAVIVTGGNANSATVFAFHRATGDPLWRAGNDKASYASPILVTLAGVRVVLSANAATLTAHDPATGKLLLDHRWVKEKQADTPKGAQPVVVGTNRVFLSSGYGVGCAMIEVKARDDGKLTAADVWRGRSMKNQFNSVSVRDGFLYGLDDGFLACVDAATGERRWKDGRFGSGQSILVGDIVLIQSERGPVVLARARPDAYEELARLAALDGKTWNHPTLAGRVLLVRNDREAACYELPGTRTTR
jgi:outer membrane protein assembly factor BamB